MCNLYHPSIDPVIGLSTHWEQMVVTIANKEKLLSWIVDNAWIMNNAKKMKVTKEKKGLIKNVSKPELCDRERK